MKLQRSAVMRLIRKWTIKKNRMDRFENRVLLNFSFTQSHKHRNHILRKIISFQGIIFCHNFLDDMLISDMLSSSTIFLRKSFIQKEEEGERGERGGVRSKHQGSRRTLYPFNAASDSNRRECAHCYWGGGSGSLCRPLLDKNLV